MRTCCAHAGDTLVDERPEQRVATALRYKRAAHAAGLDDAGAAAGTYQRQRAAAMCAQQRTRGAGPAGWVAAAVLRNELAAAPANDDVTFLAHIRGGGLDLIQWKLPSDHEPDLSEATYVRRYTGGAGSAAS